MNTTQQVLITFSRKLGTLSDRLSLMSTGDACPTDAEILDVVQDLEIAALYLKMVVKDVAGGDAAAVQDE